jgi:signal transduction histidine kinase
MSFVIAVLASYAALDLAGRVTATRGKARFFWLSGGATAMGIGIWSMHYVGMMAFRLPIPVQYDWPTALVALLIAGTASGVALVAVSRHQIGLRRAIAGSIVLGGAGIAGLHYVAMASMRLQARCRYSPGLVTLSVVLAIVFCLLSLRLSLLFRNEASGRRLAKIAGALLMGSAVFVMHYTGMAAASFVRAPDIPDLSHAVNVSTLGTTGIGVVTMMVLVVAVVTSMVDRLQEQRAALRALAARLQSAREEERTRVAREVHDELGQALTAIKIDVASLIVEMAPDQKRHVPRAESILKLADGAIQSVRRIATELRPGILDDLGLVAAVEWASEEFHARTGILCRISLPDTDIAMAPERATALFRILQETLTNVARHANATEVDVRLARENGDLWLEVQDNGIGVGDEQLFAGKSLGILGMRERAFMFGGEVTIHGAPGKGTAVRVRIPHADRAARE